MPKCIPPLDDESQSKKLWWYYPYVLFHFFSLNHLLWELICSFLKNMLHNCQDVLSSYLYSMLTSTRVLIYSRPILLSYGEPMSEFPFCKYVHPSQSVLNQRILHRHSRNWSAHCEQNFRSQCIEMGKPLWSPLRSSQINAHIEQRQVLKEVRKELQILDWKQLCHRKPRRSVPQNHPVPCI